MGARVSGDPAKADDRGTVAQASGRLVQSLLNITLSGGQRRPNTAPCGMPFALPP